jgi:KDO2-lipid IV(A) lauroyltransferase
VILKKITTTCKHTAEALLAYTAYGFFAIWPLDVASAIGGWIGRTIGPRMAVSKRAYRHLQMAMPDLSAQDQDRIVRDMWDNLARNFAEVPHLKKLMPKGRITMDGWEHVERALAHGKGMLIASGHFANWEMGPIYFWHAGYPVTTVYRKPNNPLVDPLLRYTRRIMTPHLFAKGNKAGVAIVKALRQNGVAGMLVDQKMNENAAPLPFFGRPAMTGLAAAYLVLKTGATMVVGTYTRHNGAHFKLQVHPAITPPADASPYDAACAMMTEVNQYFEDYIRHNPGQWLWLHRRWSSKRKPWDAPPEV